MVAVPLALVETRMAVAMGMKMMVTAAVEEDISMIVFEGPLDGLLVLLECPGRKEGLKMQMV